MAVLMYAVIFLLIVLPVDPLTIGPDLLTFEDPGLCLSHCCDAYSIALESYSALTALRSCRTLCFVSFVEREAAPTALLLS